MSDRFNGLTVIFERELTGEQTDALKAAIMCLRGVCSVHGHVDDFNATMAVEQARMDLRKKLWEALK